MITRPNAAEYLPFANTYVQLVPEGQDPLELLRQQLSTIKDLRLFRKRYLPGLS